MTYRMAQPKDSILYISVHLQLKVADLINEDSTITLPPLLIFVHEAFLNYYHNFPEYLGISGKL